MTKKKTKAKAKGSLTVENDARGRQYDRREEKPIGEIVEEKIAEAEAEIVEIVAEETAIYQKAMKGEHIAELFSEEESSSATEEDG